MPRSRESRREYERKKKLRQYHRRKAEGICVKCRQPVYQGGIHCKAHRDRKLAVLTFRTTTKRDTGLCTNWGCNAPAQPGKTRCAPCAEWHRAYEADLYHSRRAEGLCVQCGDPASTHIHCEPCRVAHNDRMREYHSRPEVKAKDKARRKERANA